MYTIAYTFPSTDIGTTKASPVTITGYAPFTIVLQPSSINVGNNVISSITYAFSGSNYEYNYRTSRNFTYCSLSDAVTGANASIDSRSSLYHTLYNSVSGQTITYASVSALLFPSLNTITYTLKLEVNNPWLTINPLSSKESSAPAVFNEIHLLKSRSWGTNNNQIVVAEGIGSPGQIVFFNT